MTDTELRALAERVLETAQATRGADDPERNLSYRNTASAYGAMIAQAYLAVSKEKAELERQRDHMRRDCAEAYQVVAVLADSAGMFGHPDVTRALDNLAAASEGYPRQHDDLLPFPSHASRQSGG